MTRTHDGQFTGNTADATAPVGPELLKSKAVEAPAGAAEGAPREEDEPLSEKVYGWAHRAREAGEDVAADEWDWHAQAVEALESQLAQERAAREKAETERDKWYDCHAGPGTTAEACGACVTCLGRELDAAHAAETAAVLRAQAAERELGEAQMALARIREWVEAERHRRDNHNRQLEGRGGQIVGDSHSPRMVPSVLIELERLLRPEDARYSHECWIRTTEKLSLLRSEANSAVATMLRSASALMNGGGVGHEAARLEEAAGRLRAFAAEDT